jgi:hypothetical protein
MAAVPKIPEKCIQNHGGQFLVCEEMGRLIRFRKPAKRYAQKIRVDGCVITGKSACDYLVFDWVERKHFVELKGKDVDHAFKQLASTIPFFSKMGSNDPIWCFIICSESPRTTTKVQAQKEQFAEKFRAHLVVRTNQYEHTLEDS